MVCRQIQKNTITSFFALVLLLVPTASLLAQSGMWYTKTRMPTARTFLGASVVGEKLYVIGGTRGTTAIAVVEMYDPATDTWQTMASLPEARCYPKTCTFNGKIYVFGGTTGTYASGEKSVYVYDPQTDTWSQKNDIPPDVIGPGVPVVWDNMIYLIGGAESESSPPVSSTWEYDPVNETWTQKADMPTPRALLSASVVDGLIYAMGGTTQNWENDFYKQVEVFDPVTDTWTVRTDMPSGRWGLATVVVDGLIYAIGGRTGNTSSAKTEVYDPVTDIWTSLRWMQQSRTALVAGVIDNAIYATGGHTTPQYQVLSSLEQYIPELSGVYTEPDELSHPHKFVLYQNYPNPFNNSTSIRYALEVSDFVILKIYNVQGERIDTPVYEYQIPGDYSLELNTSRFPSGSYFYELHLGSHVSETRNMICIK